MPYFTTDELRALPDLADDNRFPDERLEAARDWITAIIERETGTSFADAEVTETLNGDTMEGLVLSTHHVSEVTAVTVDGVPLSGSDVAALVVDHGIVYYPGGTRWSNAARGNVTVTYTAGYPGGVPADLKEAAMRAARNWLLTSDAWSGKDSRATSIANEYGNINLAVAGPGRPTGLPDVDTTIMAWAERVRIPGFA